MARMKSKSTSVPGTRERLEFKGNPQAVKKAQRADNRSDKSIAKKFGVKVR